VGGRADIDPDTQDDLMHDPHPLCKKMAGAGVILQPG
jgi:hypothetical protein